MEENTKAEETSEKKSSETDSAKAEKNEGKTPEFDGDFDAERASRLVANLRTEVDALKKDRETLKKALGEKEDAEKSELEKLLGRAERAEKELADTKTRLLVAEVAKEFGVPVELLSGSNKEEIESRAKALQEWAGAKKPADDIPGKPKARLVPGNGASEEDEVDPVAIAAAARKQL